MQSALFVSDLHLAAERAATSERFFAFLAGEAARAEALYVLGDLFEYWIGDDELSAVDGEPLVRDVARSLRRLSQTGVAVSIMHGNRDFLLGAAFAEASGAQLLAEPTLAEVCGEPVLLLHGDTLCTEDRDYQAWRATARSEAWQRQFLAQPLAARRAAVRQMRERSQSIISEKPADIMDVADGAVRDVFRRYGARRLVHGHTHRPARHAIEVDGVARERWVLPDWYGAGGYLVIDEAGVRLVSF